MPDHSAYAEALKETWLSALLVEKIIMDKDRASLADSEICTLAGIRFESGLFCIVLVDILDIDCPPHYSLQSHDTDIVTRTLASFREALSDHFLCYPFFHANDIFMLINARAGGIEPDAMALDLADKLDAAGRALREAQGICVQVIMSSIAGGLNALSEAFTVLSQVMDAQQLHPARETVFTPFDLNDELAGLEDYKDERKLQLEHIIMQTALDHDFSATYDAFCELIDIESKYYGLCMSMNVRVRSRIETLFGLLGVPYYSQGLMVSALEVSGWISASITPEELKSSVRKTLSDFAGYFEPEAPAVRDISGEISEYVEEHYANYGLSVDVLSDKFGISLSYLSRMFKEKRGVRLLDFIHMTRVSRARELLLSTDMTVEQVGNAVGYQSKLTFNRAFKRFEGKTPGAYRAERNGKSA